VAKKKTSTKQTKKNSPSKAVKKATTPKKANLKKAAPKKVTTKAASKATNKATKVGKSKPAAKVALKASPKKTSKASQKKQSQTSKKAVAPKVVKKAAAVSSSKKNKAAKTASIKKPTAQKQMPAKNKLPVVPQHLLKQAPVVKKLDLTKIATPLDDRLIVQVSSAEKMTPGGLYIPDTVTESSGNLQGMVVAVGRGHFTKKGHLRPMDVKVGDKIVFPEYAGSKIKIQNEDLVILRESDVMGVVSK
jgi:chaperonin GroES